MIDFARTNIFFSLTDVEIKEQAAMLNKLFYFDLRVSVANAWFCKLLQIFHSVILR